MRCHVTILGFTLTVALVSITNSWAGMLIIHADPNTNASTWINEASGPGPTGGPQATVHINKNGVGKQNLGSPAVEKTIHEIWVEKTVKGKSDGFYVKPNPKGNTVASIEPFYIPTFIASSDSLVAVIDYAAFAQSGTTFTLGQSVMVNSGDIAGVPSITIYDATAILSTTNFLTLATIEGLPTYSGAAAVGTIDTLQPVPEPSCLALAGLGGLCLAIGAYKRKQAAAT